MSTPRVPRLMPLLTPTARRWAYRVYAVLGLVLGGLQVAYASVETWGQPDALTAALAVFGFLGGALGGMASANTPPRDERR